MSENNKDKEQKTILGLSTDELTGLSENDLVNNPIATRMLLHYYNQLVEENTTLNNNVNTLKTYQSAYDIKDINSKTGTILLTVGGIFAGFSATILAESISLPGVLLSISTLILILVGIYFSLFKDNS